MIEDAYQSLFTDQPDKEFIPGPGYDGGSWQIKPTSFMEDDADQRFPAFQKAWQQGASNEEMFGDDPFKLQGAVGGSGADNHRPDVAKVETFLNQADYYQPPTDDGPSGYHGNTLDKAIRDFQGDTGLTVDGTLKPGGLTIGALKDKLTKAPFSPVLYAQADTGTQNDAAPPDQPERQQVAQLAPAATRLLQWGVPAAIASGQAARNLLEDWWDKPSAPPQDKPTDQPSTLTNPGLEDTLRDAISRPLENSRGDATTQRGNDIVVDECSKVIKAEFPELGDHLQHRGGATEKGEGLKKVKEEVLNGPGDKWQGGSRPDVTFQFGDEEKERYRINTTTMRGDRMTSREQASFENLKRNLGNDLASWVPKLRPGMDEDEYRATVRDACRDVAGRWTDHLTKQGKIARPPQGME